jgi:hypothetical protein
MSEVGPFLPFCKTRARLSAPAWLLVVALLWQALLPAAHAVQSHTPVVLCSAAGARVVLLDAQGDPVSSTTVAGEHCPLCRIGGGEPALPAASLAGACAAEALETPGDRSADAPRLQRRLTAEPRAPPQ